MTTNELDQRQIKIDTICRDCVFAEFSTCFDSQTDCTLGRLDKFKKRGQAELVKDEETGVSYYKINKFCNTCRNSEWAAHKENPEVAVKKEIQLKVDIIILDQSDDNLCNIPEHDWEDKLNKAIDAAINQSIKPNKIILGLYQKTKSFKTIIHKLNKSGIRNEIVNVIKNCRHMGDFIDEVVQKSYGQYYILAEHHEPLSSNTIERLNKAVNEKLYSISMVKAYVDNSWHGLTIQTLLHNRIFGNNNLDIRDKIQELATNQNSLNMIKQWHQLPL